jgi:hypothetical protein
VTILRNATNTFNVAVYRTVAQAQAGLLRVTGDSSAEQLATYRVKRVANLLVVGVDVGPAVAALS